MCTCRGASVLGGIVGWFSHLALLEATAPGAARASLSFIRTVAHNEKQEQESMSLSQCRMLEVGCDVVL